MITAHIKTLSPPDFGGFSGKAAWILSLNGREQDVKCPTGSLTFSVTTKAFRTRGVSHTGFVCHSAPLKTTVESKISLDWICKPFGHLTVRRTSTTVYIMWNQLFCRGEALTYTRACVVEIVFRLFVLWRWKGSGILYKVEKNCYHLWPKKKKRKTTCNFSFAGRGFLIFVSFLWIGWDKRANYCLLVTTSYRVNIFTSDILSI